MLRKSCIRLLITAFLCSAILSWVQATESRSSLRWYFSFAGGAIGTIIGEKMIFPEHGGRFMIFWRSFGIGTAIWERNNFHDCAKGEFQIGDTTYHWRISKKNVLSTFPLMMCWSPYSKPLGFGTLRLYAYLNGSLWAPPNMDISYTSLRSWEGQPGLFWLYDADMRPFSYFDFGLGVSFNPLRIVPIDLRLGTIRMKYSFPSPPEPYKEQILSISRSVSSYYLTVNSSLGYDFPLSKVKVKPMWRLDLIGASHPEIRMENGTAFKSWEEGYHIGKLIVFWGPIGIGTTVYDEIELCDHVEFYRGRTFIIHDGGSFNHRFLKSFFPLIIHCIPFTKPFGYGNLSLYSYFRGSSWTLKETPEYRWQTSIDPQPSSYFDLGIGLSLNPLRIVPFDLRFGILKINYQEIPEPYEGQIVRDHITQFYISFGLSVGYWDVKRL